jgi:hypothetical protein
MPITRLIAETDKYLYKNDTCYYGACPNQPITSHTIAENYLYKLDVDLRKVLTFQGRLLRLVTKPDVSLVPVDQRKFSTFNGFCSLHDSGLFSQIDSFNGDMSKEKAALIHYRNICYGVSHIRTQQLKERHIFNQNYTQHESSDLAIKKVVKLLKGNALARRLSYCLDQHLLRKKRLEVILASGNFEDISYFEVRGDLDNPIFSGRSSYLMHPKHNIFKYEGYSFMPWVTYMTLLTKYENRLVFCWLKEDNVYTKYFMRLLQKQPGKDVLAVLAYACSDSFAVAESYYSRHASTITEIIRNFRLY